MYTVDNKVYTRKNGAALDKKYAKTTAIEAANA